VLIAIEQPISVTFVPWPSPSGRVPDIVYTSSRRRGLGEFCKALASKRDEAIEGNCPESARMDRQAPTEGYNSDGA